MKENFTEAPTQDNFVDICKAKQTQTIVWVGHSH